MLTKTISLFSIATLILGMGSAMVNAETKFKNADSITKDLIIEPSSVTPGNSGYGMQPIKTRGVKIVPVRIDQQNLGAGQTALSVEFAYDSDLLTQNAKWQLDELAQALHSKALNDNTFQIIGHTDATGSDEYNMDLSTRRAYSVVRYLNGTHRVKPGRLYAQGKGETELVDPQHPASGVNRRVEVRNLGNQ